MTDPLPPTTLVIFGISGDLGRRYLLPALGQMADSGHLPPSFKLLGLSRRQLAVHDILPPDASALNSAAPYLSLRQLDPARDDDYQSLKGYLTDVDADGRHQTPAQRLFYLSVPPAAARQIIDKLGRQGLLGPRDKLLLEKPFGTDLDTARQLVANLHRHFKEEQLYPIDHYLAKEMVQNILVFRSHNPLFCQTWNGRFISRIEIVATERLDIAGRTEFYEQTGALRDMIQSHLLQLAALTLMELPPEAAVGNDAASLIPGRRLAALRQLSVDLSASRRGQYRGYRQEVASAVTQTETFADLRLTSSAPAWQGVPIRLVTGKALDSQCTEIRLHYSSAGANTPVSPRSTANLLILRIQPDEGAEMHLYAKQPGLKRRLAPIALKFQYCPPVKGAPTAYQQVLMDAMRGDHSLFTSSDEILTSWQILAPLQEQWQRGQPPLAFYAKGSSPDDLAQGGGAKN